MLDHIGIKVADIHRARTFYEQALALAQEIGNPRSINYFLMYLGDILHIQGEYDAAGSLSAGTLMMRRGRSVAFGTWGSDQRTRYRAAAAPTAR